jgi:uncharacterized protein (DUF885 family)
MSVRPAFGRKCRAVLLAAIAGMGIHSAVAAAPIDRITDRYIGLSVHLDPRLGPLSGLPDDYDARLPAIGPDALRYQKREEDALWRSLQREKGSRLSEPDGIAHILMSEGLEARRGLRTCQQPLWSVNHITGWQVSFQAMAQAQPVGDARKRASAIARWAALPAYVDADIANLRRGLGRGYSVPKPVVARVIVQLDKLLDLPVEQSPFFFPAKADGDAAFQARFRAIVADGIYPALKRYRDFLAQDYLPAARTTLGLGALPDGAACYQALLRHHTTLDRTPAEVVATGEAAVARNLSEIAAIGQARFGTGDLPAILKAMQAAPENRFGSARELVDFSNLVLARTIALSASAFESLPRQPTAIEPLPETQAGSGMPAHYQSQSDPSKPGLYILPLDHWKTDTRGEAEIAVVHETIPGHHLQTALTKELVGQSPLLQISGNTAYVEGWGRYSERLAEELGVYEKDQAKVSRRAWMARGMVVDPGIHVFGWTRERAVAYLMESGRFEVETAEAMVDRIVAAPGQLTSYDSGGLEIAALRAESEQALGRCFDLKQFHRHVLSGGVLPLNALRERIVQWRGEAQGACAR